MACVVLRSYNVCVWRKLELRNRSCDLGIKRPSTLWNRGLVSKELRQGSGDPCKRNSCRVIETCAH